MMQSHNNDSSLCLSLQLTVRGAQHEVMLADRFQLQFSSIDNPKTMGEATMMDCLHTVVQQL